MTIGVILVGQTYPRAAKVARLIQFEGMKTAWKLSLNFFLSYIPFFTFFSFLFRKSNVIVKCVTKVTQRPAFR